jgi:tight adherence protein C
VIAAGLAFAAAALGTVAVGVVVWPGREGEGGRERTRRSRHAPSALRLLAALGAGAVRRAVPADLEDRLAAAGAPHELGARELMAAKLGAAVTAGLGGATAGAVAPGRLGLALVVVAPVAGFLAPDLWLGRIAAKRARATRRRLPELLDLLRVTVDAGVSLPAALAAVGERGRGPLAAEWRAVGREVELGVALEQALQRVERRLPLAEVRALTRALERSRRHGVPLARTIAGQAHHARSALRRQVREDAARAGPKIQLVVALLLVPSVLLLVAAALFAALVDSGGIGL